MSRSEASANPMSGPAPAPRYLADVSAEAPAEGRGAGKGRRRRQGHAVPGAESADTFSADRWAPASVVAGCSAAMQHIEGPKFACVGVTSCVRGEGRTTVAAGAAVVQRFSHGHRTVLVELDLEKPSMAGRLGVRPGPGVAEIIRGDAGLEECLQWQDDDLAVLVAGEVSGSRLTRAQAHEVISKLRFCCDVAVVDLPPLSPRGLGTDALDVCSSVLFVVRAGSTPMRQVREEVGGMSEPPLIILNGISSKVPRWLRTMIGR